jgi:rubrerythrin
MTNTMTDTLKNLAEAFAGESQAYSKYMAFAKKADDEGFRQVARLFRAAAHAEHIHALNHLRAMEGVLSTSENLQAAIDGEHFEVVSMYPPFIEAANADEARRAETVMKWAWEVEKCHEELYRTALSGIDQPQGDYDYYVCPVCGHTHPRSAPDKCPVCGAPGSRFEQIK